MQKIKAIILVLLAISFLSSIAWADCTIGLSWTPDPAQSAITEQEVWLNPDGILDNGDQILKSPVTPSTNQYEWTDTGDCLPAATVYVVTKYLTGTQVKSDEASIQDVVGAIISIAVKHQQ